MVPGLLFPRELSKFVVHMDDLICLEIELATVPKYVLIGCLLL